MIYFKISYALFAELLSGKIDAVFSRESCRGRSSVNDPGGNRSYAKLSTSQKDGASALGLKRVLGLGSYQTGWTWLHKLRQAMVRPDLDKTINILSEYMNRIITGGIREL